MFIKSEHPYEVEIAGILIPKAMYTQNEVNYGKRSYIEVTKEQLERLTQDEIFNAHVRTNQYQIVENVPTELLSPNEKVKQVEKKYQGILTQKDNEIKNLKNKIKQLEGEK
jgi:hypothetical protein